MGDILKNKFELNKRFAKAKNTKQNKKFLKTEGAGLTDIVYDSFSKVLSENILV